MDIRIIQIDRSCLQPEDRLQPGDPDYREAKPKHRILCRFTHTPPCLNVERIKIRRQFDWAIKSIDFYAGSCIIYLINVN